ncbi:SulP family inorganic anion transporter [Candidatus Magnetaquicoccus inordinatus]|uniref:SulP family inorganic anion transporter n=1 Tax=Candidatus Magnetaquicoccus inordinatus TaxID=2496818 RepID=UPI00102B39A1|nr:SulP family inorganic anion transporter [Candidatus Magnetaquicoccus inordinatus]
MNNSRLMTRFFPFLSWFPIPSLVLRDDLMAGITGALVLVPKAMAYAQLSGLPVYFGLYTALVPAFLGALWGSSRQLATGPVAVVSLMTAAAVTPLAVPMTEEFVGLALLLALLVGIIQLLLGVVKLGTIVNFVSHPVILGFMNAAAIIIALSQLDMLLGIPKGRSDSFLKDIWEMFGYLPLTHLPTLAMSVLAGVLMLTLKKVSFLAKPSVLIVVVITTLISHFAGFANQEKISLEQIATASAQSKIAGFATNEQKITELMGEFTEKSTQLRAAGKEGNARVAINLNHAINMLNLDMDALKKANQLSQRQINRMEFVRGKELSNGKSLFYLEGELPSGVESDGREWHIKKILGNKVQMSSGGDIVGTIPAGLPSFRMPKLDLDAFMVLLPAAMIISLVAFMESISMAKAMATKSKQLIDPNQELIGQGVANLGGAFFQAYPACGSFTGSAINLQAGAKTGFAMVFNGLFVGVTLLFLTPYLYDLPKAVLAVIILFAASSLLTPTAIKHTWQASHIDGVVVGVTFAVTLLAAPHLDKGIMVGTFLSLGLFLYHTMKPRVAILGRSPDGSLRDARVNKLPTSAIVTAIRFDGRLYFANVAYFEDAVLHAIADNPGTKYILIVGDGINDIDSSGEEVIHSVMERLHEQGIVMLFCGLKKQVLDVFRATGLMSKIGEHHYATADLALEAIYNLCGAAGYRVDGKNWCATECHSRFGTQGYLCPMQCTNSK